MGQPTYRTVLTVGTSSLSAVIMYVPFLLVCTRAGVLC